MRPEPPVKPAEEGLVGFLVELLLAEGKEPGFAFEGGAEGGGPKRRKTKKRSKKKPDPAEPARPKGRTNFEADRERWLARSPPESVWETSEGLPWTSSGLSRFLQASFGSPALHCGTV